MQIRIIKQIINEPTTNIIIRIIFYISIFFASELGYDSYLYKEFSFLF